MSFKRNVVKVHYCVDDVFKVPPHIDLEDYSQVKSWGVKYNILRINLKDGTTLNIESEWDSPSNFDWKYPEEEDTIVEEDDGQYGLDWDDEEKEEAERLRIDEEPKPLSNEEEDNQITCGTCDKPITDNDKLLQEELEERGFCDDRADANCVYCWEKFMKEMIADGNAIEDWEEGLFILVDYIPEAKPLSIENDPCEDCGQTPSGYEGNGKYLCEDCFNDENEIAICYGCDKPTKYEDIVDTVGGNFCGDCSPVEEEPVSVSPIEEYKRSIQAVIDEKLKEPLAVEVSWLLEKIKELPLKQYSQMKLIRDWLFTIEEEYYDEEFSVPAEMREKIYGVGLLIHTEGGFQLQQRCFYLAVNFMDDEKKRMKAIEYCWSGAGEWMY